MKFHGPSFLLGFVAGAGSAAMRERLRPLALEVATTMVRALDGVAARLVMKREDLQDFLAEARVRARGLRLRETLH